MSRRTARRFLTLPREIGCCGSWARNSSACPLSRMAEAQAASGATVYYYNLRYSIPSGRFGSYSPHGIDIPLIFEHVDTSFARNTFGYSSEDHYMARIVHAAWVSFIKSGQIDGATVRMADL